MDGGVKLVRSENYDSFFTANQDQSVGSWYKLDDGEWEPLILFDNYTHGNDQAYAGPYSFAIETASANTIQFRWWLTGDYSWFWAIDNVEVVGYSGTPDGPDQPVLLEPTGSVSLDALTRMKGSAYNDPTGGAHVFSEWEVRLEDRTWGNLVRFSDTEGDFLIDYPVLRTSIQPNEFALNAVNPDDVRGSNDVNARSEDPPHEPILFGREQPGAQFEIDLSGDQTILNLPDNIFKPGETYKARVRYWNDAGLASPWSEEVTFSVNPVAENVVLEENFDSDSPFDPNDYFTKVEFAFDRLNSAGWDVLWLDIELGLLQIHGDALNNFALDDTETDARGLNGHFSEGVLHAEDAFSGSVITPSIDNSNGGPLTLIVDSSWRTSLVGTISVLINGTETILQNVGQAQILEEHPEYDNGSGGVYGIKSCITTRL